MSPVKSPQAAKETPRKTWQPKGACLWFLQKGNQEEVGGFKPELYSPPPKKETKNNSALSDFQTARVWRSHSSSHPAEMETSRKADHIFMQGLFHSRNLSSLGPFGFPLSTNHSACQSRKVDLTVCQVCRQRGVVAKHTLHSDTALDHKGSALRTVHISVLACEIDNMEEEHHLQNLTQKRMWNACLTAGFVSCIRPQCWPSVLSDYRSNTWESRLRTVPTAMAEIKELS